MRHCVCLCLALFAAGCASAGELKTTPVVHKAVAASCAEVSPAAQFAAARLVFVGRMLPGRTVGSGARAVLSSPARMRAQRYLKGRGPSTVTVLTAQTITTHGVSVGEDGIEPRAGQRWKIYTGSRRQPFDTSICDGSRRIPSRPAPPTTGNPSAALALWRTFPVHARPRPIVPLGEGLVLAPASGFRTGDAKLAYLEGRFVLQAGLPAGPGTAGGDHVIGAADAFGRLQAAGRPEHDNVPPLTVTAARLGAATFVTDHGRAQLPAWAFSFRGVDAPAWVLAVAPPRIFIAPRLKRLGPPGPGNSIEDSATTSASGTAITLSFAGAPPGTGPCEASYRASAVADERAVAFTITEISAPVPQGVACPALAVVRTAVLHLRRPLGGRVLISGMDGGAIPVKITAAGAPRPRRGDRAGRAGPRRPGTRPSR